LGVPLLTREKALSHFFENEVYKQNYEVVKALDDYCKSEKEQLLEKFSNAFEDLCSEIAQLQEKGEKEDIGYIHVYVLRTDVLFKEYQVWFSAYSEMFYMDTKPVQVSILMPELFDSLEASEQYLLKKFKPYVMKVTKDDALVAVQQQVLGIVRYVVQVARAAVKRILSKDGFQSIKQADNFIISCGEYRDYSEALHLRLSNVRTSDEVRDMINAKHHGEFDNEYFVGLELQDLDLRNSNFCMTDFSGSNLSQSDMRYSSFMVTNFSRCKMNQVDLKDTLLHDADFENANLHGAEICNAQGGLTEPKLERLYSPGFNGVNFRGADLTDADLSNSDFSGADFRAAVLKNTKFDGSALCQALFDKGSLRQTSLSDAQLAEVIAK